MRVLFVAAELAPFAKVGGLGDVISGLPRALARLGLDVRIALPKYRGVPAGAPVGEYAVRVGREERVCTVFAGPLLGGAVPVYFLGHDPYFDRPGIYGEGGTGYPDEPERFVFLSRAAVELPGVVGWSPDLVHVHDWHTALVPVLLRTRGSPIRSVLTVHNFAYQGELSWERGEALGLTPEEGELVRHGEGINLLAGGIRAADEVTTVSPSYARESLLDAGGLEGELRARGEAFIGILNGIDTEVWDPARDPHLWKPYGAHSLKEKAENKRRLQEALGLQVEDVPLAGFVARLVEQKGLDLVQAAFERMMALGIQLVVLGQGDRPYEEFLRGAERRYPGRVRALVQFSECIAHWIEGGADLFLMPSRFEPCGLNQLYSLRYGTVPVVHATGGLRDTVVDYDPVGDTGNGFVFDSYTPEAFLEALARAVRLWREDRAAWERLVRRGMAEDHSWDGPAREYLALYARVLGRG
ncbi:MAG: glycogen synthase GlgA [Candidatus Bipolaricaulota bacterium]|nr:glycogen synthase GlgA [Candidatus Bipolaricaulota bacterium]